MVGRMEDRKMDGRVDMIVVLRIAYSKKIDAFNIKLPETDIGSRCFVTVKNPS
jgi:hypothetical protein